MWDDEEDGPELGAPGQRDPRTDEAKQRLRALLRLRADEVFYLQQLKVLLEDEYFHWITDRALHELLTEGVVVRHRIQLPEGSFVDFYWARGARYWRRKVDTLAKLVREYGRADLGLGPHAEMLHTAALAKRRFIPVAENVRELGSHKWKKTGHNLDRIFERDGVHYGTEIKNTLAYIGRSELQTKLEICDALGLTPLFIVRMAPKSYIDLVRKRGGFTLVIKWQLYPFGHGELARRVRAQTGLPTDSPRAVADGTVERLLKWHSRRISNPRDL